MTLRDALEYRAADTNEIVTSIDELEPWPDTVYARPAGATEWGYFAGAMYFDGAYVASHQAAM